MGVEITPALRQAAFLFALAQHLTKYSDLEPVNVLGRAPGEDLQLRSHGVRNAGALVAWADSLTEPSVSVKCIGDAAYVDVTGGMPTSPATVWTTIDGFLEHSGWESGERTREIGLDVLREFDAVQGVA